MLFVSIRWSTEAAIRYEVAVETFEGDRLASDRVRLRPHLGSDAADHVRWRNDAEVAYWATAGDVRFWPVAAAAVERWFIDKLPEMNPRSDGVLCGRPSRRASHRHGRLSRCGRCRPLSHCWHHHWREGPVGTRLRLRSASIARRLPIRPSQPPSGPVGHLVGQRTGDEIIRTHWVQKKDAYETRSGVLAAISTRSSWVCFVPSGNRPASARPGRRFPPTTRVTFDPAGNQRGGPFSVLIALHLSWLVSGKVPVPAESGVGRGPHHGVGVEARIGSHACLAVYKGPAR